MNVEKMNVQHRTSNEVEGRSNVLFRVGSGNRRPVVTIFFETTKSPHRDLFLMGAFLFVTVYGLLNSVNSGDTLLNFGRFPQR